MDKTGSIRDGREPLRKFCPMYRAMIEPRLCMGCDFQDGNQCSLVALAGASGKIPTTSLRLLRKLLLFRERTFPRKGGHTWSKPPVPERWSQPGWEEETFEQHAFADPGPFVEDSDILYEEYIPFEQADTDQFYTEHNQIEELLREISEITQVGEEEVLWDTYESLLPVEPEVPMCDLPNPADIPLPGDADLGLADLPPSVTELPHVEPEEPWPMP